MEVKLSERDVAVSIDLPHREAPSVALYFRSADFALVPEIAIYAYRHADLDGLASVYAMAELAHLFTKQPVYALMAGAPQFEAHWAFERVGAALPSRQEHFAGPVILVDTPFPEEVGPWMTPQQVITVVDHHADVDERQIGRIPILHAPIGANATLVTELYAELQVRMSVESARLLYLALMSNTAALRSSDTHPRDIQAASLLAEQAALPGSCVWEMFRAKSSFAEQSMVDVLRQDLPALHYQLLGRKALFAQLEVVDVRGLLDERGPEIADALNFLARERGAYFGVLSMIELGSSAESAGATYFVVTHLGEDSERIFSIIGLTASGDGLLFIPRILTRKHTIRMLEQARILSPLTES